MTLPPPAHVASDPSRLAAGEQGHHDEGIKLSMIFTLIVKHAFWVILLVIAGPGVAAAWLNRQVKVYEASSTIVYDFSQPRTLGKGVDVYDPYAAFLDGQEILATEERIITSMRVARQVVVDTGLDTDRAFLAQMYPGVPPDRVKADDIAAYVRGQIKVEGIKGTHVSRISVEDSEPARAQRLVMAVIDTYVRLSNEDSVGTTGAALEWLNNQVVKLQRDLESSEMSLHEFKISKNLLSVSMDDQNNLLKDEIATLNHSVTEVNIKRATLLSRATQLAKVTRSNPDELAASELLNDSDLQKSRTDYLSARTQIEVLKSEGKLESHPDVRNAQTRMDQALDAFIHQVRNLQQAALRDAAVATAEASTLSGLLERSKTHALDLNLQEIEFNRLHRSAMTNEKLYQSVLDRLKEVDLSRMINTKSIKVLDPAMLPGTPIRPNGPVALGVGAAIGLLLGLIVAAVRELSDRTIKTPADLEQRLHITSLGILPDSSPAKQGKGGPRRHRGAVINTDEKPELIVHDHPTSSLAEAARSIRSNILFMSPDRPPKTLLVTSAGVGEGKTTTATTLAATFAQTGARVLLVDLDLRRPRLHRVFATGADKGITTVLLGEPLEEAVKPTPVPNLFVLPAGPIPPNPAELLISEKMGELLQRLSASYDRVVIDSPPINPITDAVILSTRVDATVLVVRAFRTTLDQTRLAVRSLLDVNAHLLGAILNAVDLQKLEYKYSYYYRYYGGYGDGARRSEPGKKSEAAA